MQNFGGTTKRYHGIFEKGLWVIKYKKICVHMLLGNIKENHFSAKNNFRNFRERKRAII